MYTYMPNCPFNNQKEYPFNAICKPNKQAHVFDKDCTFYFVLYNQLLTPRQFQQLQGEIPSKKIKTALIYFSLLHGDNIVRGYGSIGVQ